MLRIFAVAAALILLPAATAMAQESDEASPPQTRAELADALEARLSESSVPGAQVVVIEDGEVSLSFTYGVADRDTGNPVTEDTVFRAGSISKSFVGVALMMAVEDGLLTLETPIAQAAPDIEFFNGWEETEPLTLAHVMEHTAGSYDFSSREFLMSEPDMTIAEGLAVNPANRISRWRPGTYFSYANSGAPMAAHAIELARGQDYDSLLRETVMRPLGMEVSDLQLTPAISTRLSQSYSQNLDTPIPYFHMPMRPSGALNTTAPELAQFVRLMIGRGEVDGVRLLSPASVDRIERSETLEAVEFYGMDVTYGLGNAPVYAETTVLRGHDGAIDGFHAAYAYSAPLESGYVILLNQNNDQAQGALAGVLQDFLLRDFEPNLPDPYPAAEEDLANYEGFYINRTPRNRFEEAMTPFSRVTRATYSPETGLVVAGVPRIPNGEHTMRKAERAESSFARALDRTRRNEFRYSMTTLVEIPLWQRALRILAPAALGLGAIMALGYEFFRLPFFVVRRMRRKPAPPKRRGPGGLRSLPFLSGLCLLALGYLFYDISQLHFTQLDQVAQVSPLTLGIFALTIAIPVFAALGFLTAAASPGETGWGKRSYFILSTGLILAGSLWLSQWGWIGIRVWTF